MRAARMPASQPEAHSGEGILMVLGRLRAARGEEGFTLAELVITMSLMGIVAAAFMSVMTSIQSKLTVEQKRSQSNDAARLALEQLDREIRSGDKIYDPASESPANYQLRVYTESNAPTRSPATQCVQWRIESSQLKRRSYQVVGGTPSVISGWRIVADGIVNRDVSPNVPAFSLDSS